VSRDRQPADGERVEPLDTILDRLIPADSTAGAADFGLAAQIRERVPDLDDLLERLASFAALSLPEQDALLRQLDDERDPIFESLVVTVHELYYADPRSWPLVGYTTHLPGRA
jgi:hypothetical protein